MNTIAAITHHYRRWEDKPARPRGALLAIILNGVVLAFKQAKTRTLIMTSGFLVLGACGMFYAISFLETLLQTKEAEGAFGFLRGVLGIDLRGLESIGEYREVLWRSAFLLIIKIQLIWVLIVVARVGAGLIASDLKARALPIYFSKPVTPATYLLGKWAVMANFIALVMLLPNLAALGLGTAITGGPGSWGQILSIGAGLIASGILVCVVAGAIILALSSLTPDQRYVAVAWVALCLLSIFAQKIVRESIPPESTASWMQSISLRDNVVAVTERLLGVRQALQQTKLSAERFSEALSHPMTSTNVLVLVVLTAVCLFICWQRVVRFSRSASTIQ